MFSIEQVSRQLGDARRLAAKQEEQLDELFAKRSELLKAGNGRASLEMNDAIYVKCDLLTALRANVSKFERELQEMRHG